MTFKSFILTNLILPITDLAIGTDVYYWYRQINKMYQWDRDKVDDWQSIKLNKLIIHFYQNTTYYKQLFDELCIDPYKVFRIEDLKDLPPLTKKIIRERYRDLVPNNLRSISYKNAATGGSTGDPLRYYLDLESWSYTTASNIYSFQLKGLEYGRKYVALGSSSLFPNEKKSLKHWIFYGFRGKIPLNGINMSDNVMDKYLKFIIEKKIKFIYGYASSIYLLARYVKKSNITIKLTGCFPTSEVLTNEYRHEISEAFNCLVMDGYGARDGGITADEITPGFYHVGYNSIAETVDHVANNTGKLLVTDLLNYAFPFIRYDIGDEVVLEKESGHIFNGQIFSRILGRESSVIRLENGNVLTGPGFTILFKDLNVVAYRVSKARDMTILVEIQPNDNYSIIEESIINDVIKKQAGSDCEVEFRYYQEFPESANGKLNYFVT